MPSYEKNKHVCRQIPNMMVNLMNINKYPLPLYRHLCLKHKIAGYMLILCGLKEYPQKNENYDINYSPCNRLTSRMKSVHFLNAN